MFMGVSKNTMPLKLEKCIKAVQARGGPSAKYAWGICVKSTKLKPHKRKSKTKKGGR
jgi:hypothetical protein